MLRHSLIASLVLLMTMSLVPSDVAAQSTGNGMPMRTSDGQPDVSGMFTFRTITPFQRPEQFADQETLDRETAAQFEASERIRQNRDLFDPEKGSGGYQPRSEGGVLS